MRTSVICRGTPFLIMLLRAVCQSISSTPFAFICGSDGRSSDCCEGEGGVKGVRNSAFM